MKLSVIICTYNPKKQYLDNVLLSLKHQTLSMYEWELILIDNNSDENLSEVYDLSWHPKSKVVRESVPGLIYARIRGTKESEGEVLVSVDDDTPLSDNYLEHIKRIYNKYPKMGIVGGRTIPLFEVEPQEWVKDFYGILAIRDLGEKEIITQLNLSEGERLRSYPSNGALLIAPKKKAMQEYINYFNSVSYSRELGRKGSDLASGEDNDINLFILKQGYQIGYFPELKFYHIIPKERLDPEYLGRLNYRSTATWIKLLYYNGICPWPAIPAWSVWLRKIKNYIQLRAWQGCARYVKWRGNCGRYEALAEIVKR